MAIISQAQRNDQHLWSKTWKDLDEKYRPEAIEVNLLQNGQTVDTKKVTAKQDWKYEFTNLSKYDDAGKLFTYRVEELDVPGYRSDVGGFDITNTQKTYAVGDYVWVDDGKEDKQGDQEKH